MTTPASGTGTDAAAAEHADPARNHGSPMAGGSADVVVVGGGVVGMSVAWRAATRGLTVTVVDPAPGGGASRAAAGMLAPVTEASYGEEALLRLSLESARRFPSFVDELEGVTGHQVGYHPTGTLAVALDQDDRAVLDELGRFQRLLGLEVSTLSGREARRLEPMLSPAARGGIHVPGDHSVDSRRLSAALLVAAERAGVTVRRARVSEVVLACDRVSGVVLDTGDRLAAGTVVLAAGCWSGTLGLPPEVVPPVRPVKGQILRLRAPAGRPFVSRTVRGLVKGTSVYVVPRADGEVVVGATVEEMGFDTTVTAGGVYELLRDAHEILPGVTELALTEASAGLRPGSPDNAPLVGPTALRGLVLATGHHRNGVLLAPVTADGVASLVDSGELPAEMSPFAPQRFATPAPDRGTVPDSNAGTVPAREPAPHQSQEARA